MTAFLFKTLEDSRKTRAWVVAVLSLVNGLALLWTAGSASPTTQELSVFGAGVYHWDTGKFDHFRVNPPLVRLLACLPVCLQDPVRDWDMVEDHYWRRNEIAVGKQLYRLNQGSGRKLFFSARCVCIAMTVAGGACVYLWACNAFGPAAGCMAYALWCLSPIVLGYGALLSGDIQTSAAAVAVCYAFYGWLDRTSARRTIALGLLMGIAFATKNTLIILIPVFAASAVVDWLTTSQVRGQSIRWSQLADRTTHFGVSLLLAYWILVSAYGYAQLGRPLGEFEFVSRSLAGDTIADRSKVYGNRFSDTPLSSTPTPFPRDYILGIDQQRRDFEVNRACFVLGEWRRSGVWWYYAVGLLVKCGIGLVPLCLYSLLLLGTQWNDVRKRRFILSAVFPAASILVLVSSQTALNEHVRYAFPVIPLLHVTAVSCLSSRHSSGAMLRVGVLAMTLLCVADGVRSIPHSTAFLNWMGRDVLSHGHAILGSSVDWGQDLRLVQSFFEDQEIEKYGYAHEAGMDPSAFGVPVYRNRKPEGQFVRQNPDGSTGEMDYLAVSINRLMSQADEFPDFRGRSPDAVIGRTTYVFRTR